MSFVVGTDTYGRVKSVGGTPIVTKFSMLQFLPLLPLESYYFSHVTAARCAVPFVAEVRSATVAGLPLARVDRTSVAVAYLRGVCAALTVIGFMVIFPLIAHLTGEHLDAFAINMAYLLGGCFAIGIVGGLLSYIIPLTPRREYTIRRYCGELLGLCADPARLRPVWANSIVGRVVPTAPDGVTTRSALLAKLLVTRAGIAHGEDVETLEAITDELLHRLTHMDRVRV